VDSGKGVAHGKCVGVDSGVVSQLGQRVPYAMFFFGFGLRPAPVAGLIPSQGLKYGYRELE
jgi:hypothetical protein